MENLLKGVVMLKGYCCINDLNPKALQMIKESGVDLVVSKEFYRPNGNELKILLEKYDVLIVGVKSKFTSDMLENITTPKIICSLSIGLDHIAKEFFNSKFITIINCPTANVNSVAEHIIGMLLALNKRLIEANEISIKGGTKLDMSTRNKDVSGLTLGLVGAGKISRAVLKFASVFDFKVLCYTKNPDKHTDLIGLVDFVSLENLLSQSDIVSVNIPLNEETRNLINKEKIKLLKPTATFINTARAEIVDIFALLEKADKYESFLVGLDIDITDEFLDCLSKKRNNVLVTPHIAGVSTQALEKMDLEIAQNLKNYLKDLKSV